MTLLIRNCVSDRECLDPPAEVPWDLAEMFRALRTWGVMLKAGTTIDDLDDLAYAVSAEPVELRGAEFPADGGPRPFAVTFAPGCVQLSGFDAGRGGPFARLLTIDYVDATAEGVRPVPFGYAWDGEACLYVPALLRGRRPELIRKDESDGRVVWAWAGRPQWAGRGEGGLPAFRSASFAPLLALALK